MELSTRRPRVLGWLIIAAISNPEIWAIAILIGIGVINWFGPRHAGSFAILISIATVILLYILVGIASLYAFEHIDLAPAQGGLAHNWSFFVSIILAISGIDSIPNMTRVMKDPAKNSRRAILTNEVGYTIAEQAATLGVERLVLGATQRSLVDKALIAA